MVEEGYDGTPTTIGVVGRRDDDDDDVMARFCDVEASLVGWFGS